MPARGHIRIEDVASRLDKPCAFLGSEFRKQAAVLRDFFEGISQGPEMVQQFATRDSRLRRHAEASIPTKPMCPESRLAY